MSQNVYLQEKEGNWRLKMKREANIIGCNILHIDPPGSPSFSAIQNLPMKACVDLLEGAGYGADLREIATGSGFTFSDPYPGKLLPEVDD